MGSFYQAHRSCIQSTEIKYSTFVRQALLQRKRWPESRNLSFFPLPQLQIHLQILLLLCSSDCSEPHYGRGRSWAHQELHTPGFILLGDHPLLPGRFKRIPSKALSLLPPAPSRASPRLQLPPWSREKPQGAKPPGNGQERGVLRADLVAGQLVLGPSRGLVATPGPPSGAALSPGAAGQRFWEGNSRGRSQRELPELAEQEFAPSRGL